MTVAQWIGMVALAVGWGTLAAAYTPIVSGIDNDGTISLWADGDSGVPEVAIVIEDGDCADNSNAEMALLVQSTVDAFTNVALSTMVVELADEDLIGEDGDPVTGDINLANFTEVLLLDNFFGATADGEIAAALLASEQNPLIFDDNALITFALVGEDAEDVLGFAYPFIDTATDTIFRSEEVINCLISENRNSVITLEATIIHELGHGLGLGHTQIHQAAAEDGDDNNNDTIPLMYPVSVFSGSDPTTLQFDDEIGLAVLYPEAELDSDYWTLSGTLEDDNGDGIPCANMVLVDTADPEAKVLSSCTATTAVFSETADSLAFTPEDCESGCGDFEFKGLDPDKTYELSVEPIDADFVSGSAVCRCTPVNSAVPTVTFDETFSADAATTEVATIACNNADCDAALIERTNAETGSGSDDGSDDGDDGSDGSGGSSAGGCSLSPDF